jgi:serine/threonine protein kinase
MIAVSSVGSVLAGRYALIGHIARGGMGDVYVAEDRQLQRRVAVKVFRAAEAGDRARFDAEVVLLAALDHPGLVRVFDAGEQDGDAFVVLDLIEGPTLASLLAAGRQLSPSEVAELGTQLADALAYIHAHGIVHRDLTPSNVLCDADGRAHLADFGIARLVDTTRVTSTGTTLGTAAYMAPEQVQGHDVTPAADVYALGLVLLELLTGRQAFTGSPQEIAVARLARSPDTETGVPDGWCGLLRTMTDSAPLERPPAAKVRDQLQVLLANTSDTTGAPVADTADAVDETSSATSDAATRVVPTGGTTVMPATLIPNEDPRKRGRSRALLAGVVALLLLIGAVAIASQRGPEREAPSTTITNPVTSSSTSTTDAPTTTETPAEPSGNPEEGPGNVNGKGKGPKARDD